MPANVLTATWMLLGVGVAGGIGAVFRFWLSDLRGWLPWGTLLANTIASVVGGIAVIYFADASMRLTEVTLVAGFAGGLSTLSTFAGQTTQMLAARQWLKAVVYTLASFVIPSTAVALIAMFR